jgi:hypothetical protein
MCQGRQSVAALLQEGLWSYISQRRLQLPANIRQGVEGACAMA